MHGVFLIMVAAAVISGCPDNQGCARDRKAPLRLLAAWLLTGCCCSIAHAGRCRLVPPKDPVAIHYALVKCDLAACLSSDSDEVPARRSPHAAPQPQPASQPSQPSPPAARYAGPASRAFTHARGLQQRGAARTPRPRLGRRQWRTLRRLRETGAAPLGATLRPPDPVTSILTLTSHDCDRAHWSPCTQGTQRSCH